LLFLSITTLARVDALNQDCQTIWQFNEILANLIELASKVGILAQEMLNEV